MERGGLHSFEKTADPGPFGAAGIERMHQGAAGLAEGVQRPAEITVIRRVLRDTGLRRGTHDLVEDGEQLPQTRFGDRVNARGDDQRGCQNPAPGPQNGLLDAQDEQLRGQGVQDGEHHAERAGDEEGHRPVAVGRGVEHPEDAGEEKGQGHVRVPGGQDGEAVSERHPGHGAGEPPTAPQQDVPGVLGVDEDDPCRGHGPVPQVRADQMPAEHRERGRGGHLESLPRRRPPRT